MSRFAFNINKENWWNKIIKNELYYQQIFWKIEIDIVRFLPIIREENKYIIVAIDYFSRWPEARPLKVVNADTVMIFL